MQTKLYDFDVTALYSQICEWSVSCHLSLVIALLSIALSMKEEIKYLVFADISNLEAS